MKNYIIAILSITFLLNLYFIPKKENNIVYDNKPESFKIHLEGEVHFPGVYEFYQPISLNEVINFSGGFTKNANTSNINLNEIISENTFINIDKTLELEEEINPFEKLNLNKASFQELINIPHITETRAANIIIYREQNGAFSSVEELINVKNIGEATLEKVKEYFKV